MNEQARQWAYIEMAADQFEQDGVVDVVLLSQLDATGYDLSALPDDIQNILSTR